MAPSRSQIDREGRYLADHLRAIASGEIAPGHQRERAVRAVDIVEWWRKEHAQPLTRVAANLRYYAAAEGKPIVAQRLKRVPTIAHKLIREPGMKLSRMGDIGGVRAVLPSQDAAYRIASRLRRNWTITRYSDYVTNPKEDGYRALHLINRNHGRLIEVQLRTVQQDFWANGIEIFSRSIAPGLKFGDGPEELRTFFILAGELYAAQDQDQPVDAALLRELKALKVRVDTLIEDATR